MRSKLGLRRPHPMRSLVAFAFAGCALAPFVGYAGVVRADDYPLGKPPEEAKAMVEAPKGSLEETKIERPGSATNVSLSAGGQLATGNSRLAAATANGLLEKRW